MPIHVYAKGSDLIPHVADAHVTLGKLDQRWGDQATNDALILLCQLAASGFSPVFEIGTFRGRTTYNLALNSNGRVYTLDLGRQPAGEESQNVVRRNYGTYRPGELFLDAPAHVRENVELIIGDSATIDLPSLYGKMGMVIVDAGHSYEAVLRDTLLAMKLARPGGLILWDDYGDYWPGVKQAVDKLAESILLSHVRRENLVVYQHGLAKAA